MFLPPRPRVQNSGLRRYPIFEMKCIDLLVILVVLVVLELVVGAAVVGEGLVLWVADTLDCVAEAVKFLLTCKYTTSSQRRMNAVAT